MSAKEYDISPTKKDKLVDEIELLLSFIFLGICGAMARAGLNTLLDFELMGTVWPNFTGCFMIGFAPAFSGDILMPMLGTGLSASITSFSDVITGIFNFSTTRTSSWADDGYAVPLFMARILVELCCCFGAYLAGSHLGEVWEQYIQPSKLSLANERKIRQLCGALGVAAWAVCIVTTATTKDKNRVWALYGVFAPLGLWCRYFISKLNGKGWFKTGTFLTNILATLISCVLELCNQLPNLTSLQYVIITGLKTGFSGTLSTMATFVKEAMHMPKRYGYVYGVTLFAGYILAFVIIGSYKWSRS